MDTATPILCSVEILTHDSGATLRRALESVKEFAEIIIVDGNSTDDTLVIAREFGAKVITQDSRYLYPDGRIKDFASVRNQGLVAATEPWFFFLDSDEYASPELVRRMRDVVAQTEIKTYRVARQYVYDSQVITCSATYPNRQTRLFYRSAVGEFRKKVHERITIPESATAGEIQEPILVPISPDIAATDAKTRHYLGIEVARLRMLGRRALWSAIRSSLRNAASFSYRYARSRMLCCGSRLPFLIECRELRYQLRLIHACVRALQRPI